MPNLIDQNRVANLWTPQDRDMYNRLPIYMAKTQVEFFKKFYRWAKILNGINWSPNMGFTMQGVHKNLPPVNRSQAFPNPISSAPMKDVIQVRESKEQVQVYRHNFESDLFHFLPSFVDFLTDSIDKTNEGIVQQMAVYTDLFYRTAIFHGSDNVWIAGKASGTELTAMPFWKSPTITEAKTAANLQSAVALAKPLTLRELHKIGQVMMNDIGATFFSGDIRADGSDGTALAGKYAFISGMEVWQNFIHDSFLQGQRPLELDIITKGFTGSLFGMFSSTVERFELRIKADGTMPAPELLETNTERFDEGEPKMNPEYVNAPYAVAFVCGGEAYKSLKVGPPPKDFQGMTMKEFANLNWNGKVDTTTNVMVPSLDANGVTVMDTNKRGEYQMLISDIVLGILPTRRRNIVPIIYQRSRI